MYATLFAVDHLKSPTRFRGPAFRKLVSGGAEILISDGGPEERLMRRERITRDDIDTTLRANGIDVIEKVRIGHLDDDGEISALLYRDTDSSEQVAFHKKHRKSRIA